MTPEQEKLAHQLMQIAYRAGLVDGVEVIVAMLNGLVNPELLKATYDAAKSAADEIITQRTSELIRGYNDAAAASKGTVH